MTTGRSGRPDRALRSVNDVFPPSRSAQAESYLQQACEDLRSAGDPRFVWPAGVPSRHGDSSPLGDVQRRTDAAQRRLEALRSSVIFCALAFEAYSNAFMEEVLQRADTKALERLSPVDKLLIAARLSGLQIELPRGSEPMQTVSRLFVVRNQLVHPRSSGYSAFVRYLSKKDQDDLGPRACGNYIRRVAEVVATIDPLCRSPHYAGLSTRLTRHPQVISSLIDQIGEGVIDLPSEDAESPVDLSEAAERAART